MHSFPTSSSSSIITLADMSRPKVGMFAKYVIPQTSFDFALHRKDFRLIWAINCGSFSLVPLVPVYEPHLLDAQLDAVMRCGVVLTSSSSQLNVLSSFTPPIMFLYSSHHPRFIVIHSSNNVFSILHTSSPPFPAVPLGNFFYAVFLLYLPSTVYIL